MNGIILEFINTHFYTIFLSSKNSSNLLTKIKIMIFFFLTDILTLLVKCSTVPTLFFNLFKTSAEHVDQLHLAKISDF